MTADRDRSDEPDTPRRSVRAAILRQLIGSPDFAVVSNNCWGAHIYQALGLSYSTPFVGLFVPPDSYLRLLGNFEMLVRAELAFKPTSAIAGLNAMRARDGLTYPIAMLGGEVELHFLHYANEAEARDKWTRRVARMPADPARYFFKFDDREHASAAQIAEFCAMDLPNKVCFTARPYDVATVLAPAEAGAEHVIDGLSLGQVSRKYFNALRWISIRPRWLALPSLI